MSELAERIKAAVAESVKDRNRYTDRMTAELTLTLKLKQTQEHIAKAILRYRSPFTGLFCSKTVSNQATMSP